MHSHKLGRVGVIRSHDPWPYESILFNQLIECIAIAKDIRNSDHSISPRCRNEPDGFRTMYAVIIHAKHMTGKILLDGVINSRP